MRAIVMRQFGGPEVLELEDVDEPKPGTGEILLQVHSVSVNRTLDCTVRAGKYPVSVALPHVLGVDPAGLVVAVSGDAGDLKPGDRTATVSMISCMSCKQCRRGLESNCLASRHLGLHCWGGYAEYVTVPGRNVFPIPDNLSFAEGTLITRHFPMAFNLLVQKARLQPGAWVLVMGASGALGSCCVQVAKMHGATVIAGAGADERVALAIEDGADFGVNYRRQDLAQEVMRLTGGEGVDIVCENIADPTLWPGAFNSLAIGGRLVTAGAHGGGNVTLDVRRLYQRRVSVVGAAGTNPADVAAALDAARSGKIRALRHRVLPLAQAAEAHRLVEANRVTGKLVLDPTLT